MKKKVQVTIDHKMMFNDEKIEIEDETYQELEILTTSDNPFKQAQTSPSDHENCNNQHFMKYKGPSSDLMSNDHHKVTNNKDLEQSMIRRSGLKPPTKFVRVSQNQTSHSYQQRSTKNTLSQRTNPQTLNPNNNYGAHCLVTEGFDDLSEVGSIISINDQSSNQINGKLNNT